MKDDDNWDKAEALGCTWLFGAFLFVTILCMWVALKLAGVK